MTRRVLVADPLSSGGQQILTSGGAVELVVEDAISAEDLLAAIAGFDGLIVRSRTKVTRAVLERAERLCVVGRCGVGLDNIDLQAAKERGVKVVNSAAASAISVAELSVGLILSLVREIPQAVASTRAGGWERKRFKGSELSGKVLGIVGLGNIGREVASRAIAFGMSVVFHDPYLPAGFDPGLAAEEKELAPLLETADILSIHVPLSSDTRHLIDERALRRMKPGAYVVNVARGGIVDEAALLDAIRCGHIAGAALDVFEAEPPAGSELLNEPKVIVTPHIGASTREAQERAGAEVARRMLDAFDQAATT